MRKQPYAFMALLLVGSLILSGCGSASQPTPPNRAPQVPATQEAEPPYQPSAQPVQPTQLPTAEPPSQGAPQPTPPPAGSPNQGTAPRPTTPPAVAGDLKVHFIDVGQGDSILIQLPGGKTMLIDAGEASQAANVVSYLKAQSVEIIDYLAATHPHADHIGGMVAVLDTFPVKDVFMPRTGHTTTTYENFLLKLKAKGLEATEAKAGVSVIQEAGLSAAFIAPHSSRYDDLNDWSAVLRLQYGDTVFLFTGDAGEKSESEMLLSSAASPKADVLKVGHHGANDATSAEFLQAVAPRYAVISVGAGNPYGHPHKNALDRLAALKVEVYRTDLDGTVLFITDGKNIAVNTGRPGQTPTTLAPPSKPAGAVVTAAPAPPSPPSEQKTITVYVTKTGEKYHRDGCRYLAKNKIPMTLEAAKAKGYGPCSVCRPPS